MLEQAIDTTGSAGTGFPNRAVTDFRSAKHARHVASTTVFGNHVVSRHGRAASGNCNGANALALLATYADLANRLDAFGNGGFVDSHGLSANRPQGHCGNRCRQEFLDQVHAYTLMLASQARGHGFRGRREYNGSSAAPKQPKMSQGYFPGSHNERLPRRQAT